MVGVRSAKWSDERLEVIKQYMLQGFSMSQIGAEMKETRNSIIGIITRNPDFFKGVPKLSNTKPTRKESEARRKLPSQPSRPPRPVQVENPDDLKSMKKLDGPLARDLAPPWKQAMRGDKLFFYWKMETEPTYIFSRFGAGTYWRGHGVCAMTKGQIWSWVNIQRK